MQQLIDLIRTSALTQATVTTILTLAVSYLAITQRPIPEAVTQAWFLVLGFYFGAKIQQTLQTTGGTR